MDAYLFVFGRTPELAALELSAFYPQLTRLSHSASLVPDIELSAHNILESLGGTVKIAKVVGRLSVIDASGLSQIFLKLNQSGKMTIGISTYDGVSIGRELLPEIKKILQENHITTRFVLPQDGTSLSSVVVDKQQVTELVIVPDGEFFVIGQTVEVQPFELWNRRDFGRPASDQKSGMLPIKVARMAVNIALGRGRTNQVLLDPFCGMGTILAEALLSGASVLGMDLAEEAVVGANKNLHFLETEMAGVNLPAWNVFKADATHASDFVSPASVDAIVTEPYMGSTQLGVNDHFTQEQIKNILKGLEKLYIGCLRNWKTIIKPGGKILIALPKINYLGRKYTVKRVIDTCASLGYTTLAGPIEYSRPQAVVKREFYLFQLK